LQAEYLRTIRIGTYPDEASAKKALQEIQSYAQKNSTISKLQAEWDFEFKERASGKYYITLAEPFRNREVLQAVLDNLRLVYPDIYVTRLKSYKAFEKKESPQEEVLSSQKISLSVEEKTSIDSTPEAAPSQTTILPKPKTAPVIVATVTDKKPLLKKDDNSQSQKSKKEDIGTTSDELLYGVAGFILLLIVFLLYKTQRYKKAYEEKQLESMMLQEKLEQMEQKLKNKDKIFSHTSHELRNPMGAIIGLSHLLLEESMPQKQKECVKKIEGSAKYLLEIINDILDISKMEAGALKIENREFNLNHVLRHVINIVSVAARENGTRVELDVANDVPPYIVGDSLRLTQVLVNLLSNAVKFTKNGLVVLSIRKTSQNADLVTLEFQVRDNGIGMTQSQLKNIFNSYVQASESTAREYGGTGLGLSIVKYLVDIMKGDIHVTSKKQHGTTFVLHLKFHLYKEKEKRFYRLPSKEYLNRRVLIVDSSQSNIKKLTDSFEYFNYIVHTIPSFKETLLDPQIRFDIVVVNKLLVDDALLAVIEEMKKRDKTKFILFSDSLYEEDRELLNELDIDEHLCRPFTQEDVLELLKKICSVAKTKEIEEKPQSNEAKERLKEIGKRNILIAEDNRLNHKVLGSILSDTAFELTFVEDGKAALKKLQEDEKRYDLVLLDINMPKLNGYETALEIRKLDAYKEVPILALTADVTQDAINKSYEVGMQGHISKPIIIQNFYEKLYTMLSKNEVILLNSTQKQVKEELSIQKAQEEKESQKELLKSQVQNQEKKSTTKSAKKLKELVVQESPKEAKRLSESEIQALQQNFQEVSLSAGLEHAHHDEELYKSLLREFDKLYKDSANELAELIKNNKFQEAREKALDIKETALHIGAYKLYENVAAMQYEFEKAQQHSSMEMLRYYKESLETLLREIHKYLN